MVVIDGGRGRKSREIRGKDESRMSQEKPSFHTELCPGLDRVAQVVGSPDGSGLKLGLVASRFNERFTRRLVQSAVETAQARGVRLEDLAVAWVPGAYETPLVIDRMAASGRYHALIAIGCVIEGETPHARLITEAVTDALTAIGLKYGRPVIDCVVATLTIEQAERRCAAGLDNRGAYAAQTAIEMARLMTALERAT